MVSWRHINAWTIQVQRKMLAQHLMAMLIVLMFFMSSRLQPYFDTSTEVGLSDRQTYKYEFDLNSV